MFEGGEWWIPPEIPDVPFDEEVKSKANCQTK
jgi:hypothetical protein